MGFVYMITVSSSAFFSSRLFRLDAGSRSERMPAGAACRPRDCARSCGRHGCQRSTMIVSRRPARHDQPGLTSTDAGCALWFSGARLDALQVAGLVIPAICLSGEILAGCADVVY